MSHSQLPHQSTVFIGREQELDAIAALLVNPACRLLTLVGQGGIGKTRLGLQAAANQIPNFANGIYFVALNAVESPNLLPAAIAKALEISFAGADAPRSQIIQYLTDKNILLVMDNFEHLLAASDLLTDILLAASGVKILATSRERLGLQEEWVFSLDGLAYPNEAGGDSLESYSAVQLFAQRAQQLDSQFSLHEHEKAVRSICQQVQGMPLGLELAASWLRVMPCHQIAAQIGHNPDILTSTLRNIPERHRSLRLVFEQSWRLLSDAEQAVLMHLSVFRGGFNLEAAVQVADASLMILAALVDKSLIRLNANERYDLHELLRQYAAEKLEQAQSLEIVQTRHLHYFMNLADQAESCLFGRNQLPWFDRLEADFDNLRAAMAFGMHSEAGLHLAASLGWFFSERCYGIEGLEWLEQMLAANPNAPPVLRAKALQFAGPFSGYIRRYEQLHVYCNAAIALSKSINDDWSVAWAQAHLAIYIMEENINLSTAYLEESVSIFRRRGDLMGLAHSLVRLIDTALYRNDIPYAFQLVKEVERLSSQEGDVIISAWVQMSKGGLAEKQHDFKRAKMHYESARLGFLEARFPDAVHFAVLSLAQAELRLGNYDTAEEHYSQTLVSMTLFLIDHAYIPVILAGFATMAKARKQFERAARLLAAAYDPWLLQRAKINPEANTYETDLITVRTHMGQLAFDEAWAVGAAMTRQQAVAYALENHYAALEKSRASTPALNLLTDREREILLLLSDGLNSREIADRLVLGVETIRWYLKLIYSKLDVHSRSEAIARAKALKLLV